MTMEQEETGGARRVFDQVREEMLEDAALRGGAYTIPADRANAAGFTMFDTPNSDDNLIEVLVPKDRIERLPSQASVRIRSRDGRVYLGTVVRGPYALPDGLRADAPPVVATALHGSVFLPEYHGLVSVELAGEERDGALMPHGGAGRCGDRSLLEDRGKCASWSRVRPRRSSSLVRSHA